MSEYTSSTNTSKTLVQNITLTPLDRHGKETYASHEPFRATRRWRKHPRHWSRRCWLLVGLSFGAVLLIVIVVSAVEVSRANRYPDYSALNYRLVDTYAGEGFFDQFNYFSGPDPASGFVHYADKSAAAALNLTYASSSSAILRVDMRDDINTTTGRISARIESKSTYDNGLFIFDVRHAPFGCATWPALWISNTYNWPDSGEIDIMEGANLNNIGNSVALHTTDGCNMGGVKRKQTGGAITSNCYNGTNDNAGCGVLGAPATSGAEFNSRGGGLLALEWRDAGIRMWLFDRQLIPSDLSGSSISSPTPNLWGTPYADFPNTGCNIGTHFKNNSIIVNIDFCGQWAGLPKFFSEQSGCPGTCVDYVSQQGSSAYQEAYWEFGGMWVFQAPGQ